MGVYLRDGESREIECERQTAEGEWLRYDLDAQKKEVLLTIVPNADNLNDTEIDSRQEKLRALSDELVAEARRTM